MRDWQEAARRKAEERKAEEKAEVEREVDRKRLGLICNINAELDPIRQHQRRHLDDVAQEAYMRLVLDGLQELNLRPRELSTPTPMDEPTQSTFKIYREEIRTILTCGAGTQAIKAAQKFTEAWNQQP